MSTLCTSAYLAVVALLAAASVSSAAYAYLDPGTGGLLLQAILGALAAGMMALRAYWSKVTAFFSGRSPPKAPTADSIDSGKP